VLFTFTVSRILLTPLALLYQEVVIYSELAATYKVILVSGHGAYQYSPGTSGICCHFPYSIKHPRTKRQETERCFSHMSRFPWLLL